MNHDEAVKAEQGGRGDTTLSYSMNRSQRAGIRTLYLGPGVRVLFKGGQHLLGHLLLVPGARVKGSDDCVQQPDVQLLVEVQELVHSLLCQRHLVGDPVSRPSNVPSPSLLNNVFTLKRRFTLK